MSIKSLSPYINFNGNAAEAIALYEHILGATTLGVARAGDVEGPDASHGSPDRVLHAALRMGASQLMLSDAQAEHPGSGNGNMHVSLDFDDLAQMTRAFEGLAERGSISVPLQDTFWGAKFGMLTDRFGVRWILNCDATKA